MKYYTLFIIALIGMSSCSDEATITELEMLDFTGIYTGEFYCDGTLDASAGELFTVIISKNETEGLYNVDLGDDIIFVGTQEEASSLIIKEQTLNEEYDFDVLTLSGEIELTSDGEYVFEFVHEVDDEGKSDCQTTLIKQ